MLKVLEQDQNTPVGSKSENSAENPLEILQRLYANGEISREEYIKMKEDLTWYSRR